MGTTRIVLVRHGESEWNSTRRFQGHADPPLTEAGHAQARALAARLEADGVAAVYSSDLRRAAETAAAIGERLGLPVVTDPDLREIDVGSWAGLTRAEVEQRFPEGFARWQRGEVGHDGETHEELTARVVAAVERLAASHPDETVVVVSHGGSIRALRRHAEGTPGDVLGNCATVSLSLVDGVLAVGAEQ